MKPKYWAITILAAAAVCAGVFYYLNQPAADLGPIVVRHSLKTMATPPSSASSSPTDTSVTTSPSAVEGWKTYANSQYGFSFKYPSTANISLFINEKLITGSESEGEFGYVGFNFYDFDHFNSTLSDGAFEEALKYDPFKKQWQVEPGISQPINEAFCPYERTTNLQKIAYYQIGDFRTGRLWNFAYVTTKGIIVLTEVDGYITEGVNPADVKFDNPKDVISVTCNIGK